MHDLLCLDFTLLTDTTAISSFLCTRTDLLAFEPLIHDLLREVEFGLPQAHPLLKGTNVGGGPHALSLHNLVIQQCLDVIQATQDVCASCTPFKSVKRHSCPVTLKSAQGVELQRHKKGPASSSCTNSLARVHGVTSLQCEQEARRERSSSISCTTACRLHEHAVASSKHKASCTVDAQRHQTCILSSARSREYSLLAYSLTSSRMASCLGSCSCSALLTLKLASALTGTPTSAGV